LDPHSPYSASKASADLVVKAYHDTYGMPVNITRCSNNYGPWQFPEKLIPLVINNALSHKHIPVYGDGRQIRDWLHVEDHCRAIDLVYEKGRNGDIYNVGGNNEQENIAIIRKILALLQEMTGDPRINDTLISHVADRPGHDRKYAIDASKIKRDLRWDPGVPFDEGIARTVRWYLDNRDWMSHVISGDYTKFYDKNYGDR
jgi:dTDP-glucose 4,6-dehydratase